MSSRSKSSSVHNKRRSSSGDPHYSPSKSPSKHSSKRSKRSKSKQKEDEQEYTVVHVRNLSSRTEEERLERKLQQYGKIAKVEIIRERATGISKRYGFIYFVNSQDAQQLVDCDTLSIDERDVKFELAKRAKPRPPTPGQYLGTTRKPYQSSSRHERSRHRSRSRSRSRDRYRGYNERHRDHKERKEKRHHRSYSRDRKKKKYHDSRSGSRRRTRR